MKVVVKDSLINYKEFGNKDNQTIILLHGWLDDLNSFNNILPLLADKYHLVVMDLPGMGESALQDKTVNLDFYVDVVIGFVEKLNLEPFAFIGHSFGCRILIKGLGQRKLFASKIVLIGSAGISESKGTRVRVFGVAAKGFKFLLNLPIINLLKDTVRRKVYTVIGSDYYASEHLKNIFQNVISEDLQEFAAKIVVPTLLIYGKNDGVTPVLYGQKFKRLISGSVLEVIPTGTHIVHKENPEEVAKLIVNFLCQ